MQPKSIFHRLLILSFVGVIFSILFSACTGELSPVLNVEGTPFIAPTRAFTFTPSPALTPSVTRPVESRLSPTPPCTNNLSFLEDLTIADGTVVSPNEILDKRWSVQNSGTCNWDQSYSLRLVGGPDLGADERQALYPARSGTTATLRILYTSPAEPDTYRSAWQAYDPAGQPFGDPIFIEVIVMENN